MGIVYLHELLYHVSKSVFPHNDLQIPKPGWNLIASKMVIALVAIDNHRVAQVIIALDE